MHQASAVHTSIAVQVCTSTNQPGWEQPHHTSCIHPLAPMYHSEVILVMDKLTPVVFMVTTAHDE